MTIDFEEVKEDLAQPRYYSQREKTLRKGYLFNN